MDFMTTNEAAALWGITARQVQWMCDAGRVGGVLRVGRMWLIPKSARKPVDGRTKTAKTQKAERQKEGGKVTLNEAIKIMADEIVAVLGGNALSVYLYGSVTLDDFKLGWSDIDILVLTKSEISEECAERLVGLRQTLLERYPGNVYFRSFEGGIRSLDAFVANANERTVYWGTSGQRITDDYYFDSFCMTELIDSGILMYGEDVRNRFAYPTYEQLRENVRTHYETIRKYAQTTDRSVYSYGWLLDIARCLYTLQTGKIIAKTAAGEWALTNGICPVPNALTKALEVRRNPIAAKSDEGVWDYAETLGGDIQSFVDVLEREIYETPINILKPINGFRVTALSKNDLEAVFALDKEALGSNAWKHEWFEEGLTDKNAQYALVYDGDALIAYCGCYFWDNEKSYCKVMTLAVREAYRRRGIANELSARFIDESRARGIKSVVLETNENNVTARKLYENLGFAVEEIRPNYYNNGEAGLIMRKYLSNKVMPLKNIVVRPAELTEVATLAEILCASWRSAFMDILSDEELAANTDVSDKTAMFEYVLSNKAANVRIATADGVPCGLTMYGASRNTDLLECGEIISMFALENFWGKGIGGRLMKAALWDLDNKLCCKKVVVWTFETNERARKFYEKHGFTADGTTKDSDFGGAKEVLYTLNLTE